jgi:hypothetical protein
MAARRHRLAQRRKTVGFTQHTAQFRIAVLIGYELALNAFGGHEYIAQPMMIPRKVRTLVRTRAHSTSPPKTQQTSCARDRRTRHKTWCHAGQSTEMRKGTRP